MVENLAAVRPFGRLTWVGSVVCGLLALLLTTWPGSRVAAHGFHNAALATSSLDQWLSEVHQAIPGLKQSLGSEWRGGHSIDDLRKRGGTRAGGTGLRGLAGRLELELTPQQQQVLARKANDCLEILAFLEPQNIFPEEFPNFPMQRIPQYRKAAKQILELLGPQGTQQVAGRVRAELMTNPAARAPMGRPLNPEGLPYHRDYYDDLVNLLQAGIAHGDLSEKELSDLLEAAQGQKAPAQSALAEKVRAAALMAEADLPTLLEKIGGMRKSNLREKLLAKAIERAQEAGLPALVECLPKVTDADVRRRLLAAARARVAAASLLDLLKSCDGCQDEALQKILEKQIAANKATAAEVENSLAAYWQLTGSKNAQVAAAASEGIERAFLEMKISHCLFWLGERDEKLHELIWQQVDKRIAQADAEQRAYDAGVALKVLAHPGYSLASRKASLELLGRLKHVEAVPKVAEMMHELPRELWGPAGATLRKLSGQEFGPHAGDGLAEVVAAQKQWKAWWRERGEK